ncbi:Spo0E family sporulation regulatory protein-aspartic acid phosphatase [Clostridium cagae]|uniref:Spo0E family sporulation regulatory protein-aspartic acid phosphatase n=1 Tax=Clostridium cagae TaxID=2080751 RepID=UPI003F760995
MEEARERLNKTIEKYRLRSIEALKASEEMDKYIYQEMEIRIKKSKFIIRTS